MKVHSNQYGITEYVGDTGLLLPGQARVPWVSLQMHWKGSGPDPNPPGPLVPGMAHTHIQGRFPIWAELGAGPVTIPFTMVLFNTVGSIFMVWAEFMGANGPIGFSNVTIDQHLPLTGVPGGVVNFTGRVTFDPSLATATIPRHGWFNTRIVARTSYDNGDKGDLQAWVPYFSVLDQSQSEPVYGEGTMEFASKIDFQAQDDENGGFGQHLTEFRGTESQSRGFLPILVPFNEPQTIYPLTYNYKALPTLTPHYELRLDPDFHMGIEGTVLDTTEMQLPNGQVSNVAVLDPVVISKSMAPMGMTPGKHRLAAMWSQDTGKGSPGFGPNQRIVSVAMIEVEIGDHPIPAPPTPDPDPMPMPDPAPTWDVVTPIVKRLAVPGKLSRFCLCVEGTAECVELMVGPDPEAD